MIRIGNSKNQNREGGEMKVARMISTDLKKNELPITWSHPRDGRFTPVLRCWM